MNLFGGRRSIDPEQSDRIKSWARETWALSGEATVMVTELECREPGCPPIETVIALLEGPGKTRQYKIHKSAAEISRPDVEGLANEIDHHHDA
ncbi:MAG: hypothetical protein E8D41_01245 [Nitrospira sp.]|nr:MAG: hypothetical protein E8D41_01245 [Nitrospira sp.]